MIGAPRPVYTRFTYVRRSFVAANVLATFARLFFAAAKCESIYLQ